jgi:hypothetical protein
MPASVQRKAGIHGVPVCSAFNGGWTIRRFDEHRLYALETLKFHRALRYLALKQLGRPVF